MANIRISDMTMKQAAEGFSLSFKEKIELSKLLDKLGVSVIELEGVENPRVDSLRIKSIAAAVKSSTVAVPVSLHKENVQEVWSALQLAKNPRLQVVASVSAVQMEYLYHKKPDAMISAISEIVEACAGVCKDVEFVAEDATRSDFAFLCKAVETAISAGAATVTLCDTAASLLPQEFGEFVAKVAEAVPAAKGITLGVRCSDELAMAASASVAALAAGAGEVKTAAYPIGTADLNQVAKIIAARGDDFGWTTSVQTTQLSRIVGQIQWMCQTGKVATDHTQTEDPGIYLTAHDDIAAVSKMVENLGYDLSEEDPAKVYDAFKSIAAKKEQVSAKELDAIVASAAMQVPATYTLDNYVITSGNTISATAHIKLLKNGQPAEGVYMGDGSIDAAFKAIENITGCHYELDDFQLQAVTEGREAMGQTVVKLRAGGKVYSGRGISTDIVGAGIRAYLSALNKIIYEEAEG